MNATLSANGAMVCRIPFCGFYETIANDVIDGEIESELEHITSSECEAYTEAQRGAINDRISDLWVHLDLSSVHEEYARAWAESLGGLIAGVCPGVEFKYESMLSPREYNFETDRVFCEVNRAGIDLMLAHCGVQRLQSVIDSMFTSCSGFISHYSNDLSQWPDDLGEWDHNQLYALISAVCEMHFDGDTEDALHFDVCRDAIYGSVQSAISAAIEKLLAE